MIRKTAIPVLAAVLIVAGARHASAAPLIGQVDTFEDGTTQGWTVNLLGMGGHPTPPTNQTGGQGGTDDNYLLLESLGGNGGGSKLSAANLDPRWAGDYMAAGVTAISMDVNNLGQTDLFLRFGFEDPIPGPPNNIAFTDAVFVPAGAGWMNIQFLVGPAHLTALIGTVEQALSNTTVVRLYHSDVPNFPNPVQPVPSISALLGVDNITAVGAVPEPSTLALLGLAMATRLARRRRT
jgi:hypothetical protein